jgi:DNA repair exonuclease SbcCD ATPase subunit
MIKFKKVRFKNFFSYGNYWTEFELDTGKVTYIRGENGAGKSTILEAVVFGLYGTPFRKVTKPQIPNSLNKSQCAVELIFSVGAKEYSIFRGINPNKLEVKIDGKPIDAHSSVTETQKWIEDSVICMSKKAFLQTTVISPSTFSPFMQLTAAERRAIVEDILEFKEIAVFLKFFKGKLSESKVRISEINNAIAGSSKAIEAIEKSIDEIINGNDDGGEIVGEIETLENKLAKVDVDKLKAQHNELEKAIHEKGILDEKLARLTREGKRLKKEVERIEGLTKCPTCKQDIDVKIRAELGADLINAYKKAREDYFRVTEEYKHVEQTVSSLSSVIKKIDAINQIQNKIDSLKARKAAIDESTKKNVDRLEANLTEERLTLSDLNTKLSKEDVRFRHLSVMCGLFMDDGIKAKIIEDFLPTINERMTHYLEIFNFNVTFTLDSTFKEEIKSRGYDKFSYGSFSEGEKKRIDMACLFTWRDVANMKNTSATNLLMIDEVIDSALDSDGISAIKFIMEEENRRRKNSVFVITHNDDVASSDSITIVKNGLFSEIRGVD